MVIVEFDIAIQKAALALQAIGHTAEDAKQIAEVLTWAQARGNTQSMLKIPVNGCPCDPNQTDITVEFESPVGIRLNGGQRNGIVALSELTSHVLAKVRKTGMAIGGLFNTCTGTGPIGYYARKLAEEGFIALVMCQSFELMAPFGGRKPLYGTNPLAYGIPRGSGPPLVFDAAMSGISWFGVFEAREAGGTLPEGVALDQDGNPTTDPAAALAGALRTFDGGAKGSHLALMVEMLGGALAGGAVLDKRANRNWGTTIIAIDPNILGEGDAFLQRVEDFCQRYKTEPVAADYRGSSLLLPGERSEESAARSVAQGGIEVPDKTWSEILAAADNWEKMQQI